MPVPIIPLKPSRPTSKDITKPSAGRRAVVEIGGQTLEGIVDLYFDDDNNVEHAYMTIEGPYGKMQVCRPSALIK